MTTSSSARNSTTTGLSFLRLTGLILFISFGGTAFLLTWFQQLAPDPFRPQTPIGSLYFKGERNPYLRLPFVSGTLSSIVFTADGRLGWVVGDHGTILKSENGGTSWDRRVSGTTESLFDIYFPGDGRVGWAVGANGTLLRSTDGGDSWSSRPSGVTETLRDITFTANGETGIVVGDNGTILVTANAGQNWSTATIDAQLRKVNFASAWIASDATKAWVVGDDGAMLKTENGGKGWAPIKGIVTDDLRWVRFTKDGVRGQIAGSSTILTTSDEGDTWKSHSIGPLRTRRAAREVPIGFNSGQEGRMGWLVGGWGTVAQFQVDGATWSKLSPDDPTLPHSVVSATISNRGSTIWAVGHGGTMVRTTDRGKTWVRITGGTSAQFRSVTGVHDEAIGWAVGGDGSLMRTHDAGQSWTPHTTDVRDALTSIAFADQATLGWIVGTDGTILSSANGGTTWTNFSTRRDHYSVDTLAITYHAVGVSRDAKTAIAVGDLLMLVSDGFMPDINRYHLAVSLDDEGNHTFLESEVFGRGTLRSVSVGPSGTNIWLVGDSGTILRSRDGGVTWTKTATNTSSDLYGVAFSSDGSKGMIVGSNGTILGTSDHGGTWIQHDSNTSEHLYSVTLAQDGRSGWAVGSNGTLLRWTDKPATWTVEPSGTTATLRSVVFSETGSIGVAVGDGTVVHTANRGADWRPLSPAQDYKQYRSFLAAISTYLAMGALFLLFLPHKPISTQSIATELASDKPIDDFRSDRLLRGPVALAVAGLLRNRNTEPPLTVAVTGEWGQGKTSLMRLVKGNLDKHNYRTVWFNAWHHHNEDHLFASLIQAVREQAVPTWWTYSGIRFRARLLMSRIRRRPGYTFAGMALTGLALAMLQSPDANITILVVDLLSRHEHLREQEWLRSAPSAAVFLIAVGTLYRTSIATIKSTGVNPARLIRTTVGAMRVRQFEAQLAFRHRFGEAFREVVETLTPYRLLIVIDDLDRCRPEQVLEILEATDYLVNSGPCYVMVGIAREQVLSSIALRYKDVTKGMRNPPEGQYAGEMRSAYYYAEQYLDKLINVEVSVPTMTDHGAKQLTQGPPHGPWLKEVSRPMMRMWKHGVNILFPLLVVLAVFRAFPLVDESTKRWSGSGHDTTTSAVASQTGSRSGSITAQNQAREQTRSGNDLGRDNTDEVAVFRRGGTPIAVGWSNWDLLGLLALATIGSTWLYGLRRTHLDHTKDSDAFIEALKIWHPVVRARTNSPRYFKKFVNRVRYLAQFAAEASATNRGGERGERVWEWMKSKAAKLGVERPTDNETVDRDGAGVEGMSESVIVAFAALASLPTTCWTPRKRRETACMRNQHADPGRGGFRERNSRVLVLG